MQKLEQRLLGMVFAGLASVLPTESSQYALAQTDKPPRVSQSANYPKCNLNIQQVKAGLASPVDYLNERFNCLPEVVEARKSGMLKGFLYEPSNEKLEAIFKDYFFGRAGSEKNLSLIVNSNLSSYTRAKEKNPTAIMTPSILLVFGQKSGFYIAFTKEMLSSKISNDADIGSLIKHELQHVKDWHDGIRLGNINLSYPTISLLTTEFIENIVELRARYEELVSIFKNAIEKNKFSFSVSPRYFANMGVHYAAHWNFINNKPATNLEQDISQLQLKEFEGITPETRASEVILRFNLFENAREIVIDNKSGKIATRKPHQSSR